MNDEFYKKVIAVILLIAFNLIFFKACSAIESRVSYSSRPIEEIEKHY